MERSATARFLPFKPYPAMTTWSLTGSGTGAKPRGRKPGKRRSSGMMRSTRSRIAGPPCSRNGVSSIGMTATPGTCWSRTSGMSLAPRIAHQLGPDCGRHRLPAHDHGDGDNGDQDVTVDRVELHEQPDRHEEQRDEDVAERHQLGERLMAVVRLRDDEAGQERAERERRAGSGIFISLFFVA